MDPPTNVSITTEDGEKNATTGDDCDELAAILADEDCQTRNGGAADESNGVRDPLPVATPMDEDTATSTSTVSNGDNNPKDDHTASSQKSAPSGSNVNDPGDKHGSTSQKSHDENGPSSAKSRKVNTSDAPSSRRDDHSSETSSLADRQSVERLRKRSGSPPGEKRGRTDDSRGRTTKPNTRSPSSSNSSSRSRSGSYSKSPSSERSSSSQSRSASRSRSNSRSPSEARSSATKKSVQVPLPKPETKRTEPSPQSSAACQQRPSNTIDSEKSNEGNLRPKLQKSTPDECTLTQADITKYAAIARENKIFANASDYKGVSLKTASPITSGQATIGWLQRAVSHQDNTAKAAENGILFADGFVPPRVKGEHPTVLWIGTFVTRPDDVDAVYLIRNIWRDVNQKSTIVCLSVLATDDIINWKTRESRDRKRLVMTNVDVIISKASEIAELQPVCVHVPEKPEKTGKSPTEFTLAIAVLTLVTPKMTHRTFIPKDKAEYHVDISSAAVSEDNEPQLIEQAEGTTATAAVCPLLKMRGALFTGFSHNDFEQNTIHSWFSDNGFKRQTPTTSTKPAQTRKTKQSKSDGDSEKHGKHHRGSKDKKKHDDKHSDKEKRDKTHSKKEKSGRKHHKGRDKKKKEDESDNEQSDSASGEKKSTQKGQQEKTNTRTPRQEVATSVGANSKPPTSAANQKTTPPQPRKDDQKKPQSGPPKKDQQKKGDLDEGEVHPTKAASITRGKPTTTHSEKVSAAALEKKRQEERDADREEERYEARKDAKRKQMAKTTYTNTPAERLLKKTTDEINEMFSELDTKLWLYGHLIGERKAEADKFLFTVQGLKTLAKEWQNPRK